ncbi:unnamed protein product [Fraxinus pennsylvanica]|uniref:Uncharacterized protein n=1 Tax=Fraxinus pennsylvanica TaxID=56036 RepID=A0AAD1YM13_9LAMI|nr:unnamed protein product [Fraxinus pennsylvanica]
MLFRDCSSVTCLRNRSIEALAIAALVQAIEEAQERRTLQLARRGRRGERRLGWGGRRWIDREGTPVHGYGRGGWAVFYTAARCALSYVTVAGVGGATSLHDGAVQAQQFGLYGCRLVY